MHIAISSVKSRSESSETSKERAKTPTESSQNRHVEQVLKKMPPTLICDDHENLDVNDNSDEDGELEGLSPAQARAGVTVHVAVFYTWYNYYFPCTQTDNGASYIASYVAIL